MGCIRMGFGIGKIFSSLGKNGKSLKKGLSSTSKSTKKLDTKLARHEKKYTKAHNRLAESIGARNEAQTQLTTKALDLGTNDATQRVGLSVADKALAKKGVRQQIDKSLEPFGLSSELGKGLKDGFAGTKAQAQGLSPEKYLKPTAGNYMETGAGALRMTGDVGKTVINQNSVTKNAIQFGRAQGKLKDTRIAYLAKEQGTLNKYKHGQLKSGSLQASSPEELMAMLNKTSPASNISKKDITLQKPGIKTLLPGKTPEKLPNASVTAREATENLTPQQKVHKELAERDQRISRLNDDLGKQDPVALQQAVRERDYYQAQTVGDVAKGVLSAPLDTAIVASNTAHKFIPKGAGAKPLYSPETVRNAEYGLGQSVGSKLGGGNAEKMLQSQVKVETRHAAGKGTVTELRDLHKQKALETDRNLLVDRDGDKFYDAFQSPKEIKAADKRYETTARQNLPRPEDNLYLENDVVPLVPPTISEGIRRPMSAWLNPPT